MEPRINTCNNRPFLLSIPTTPTLIGADREEDDDLDEEGFSKREQQKVMAESKQTAPGAVARLFYGASTSTVVTGALSGEEWDMLEQYAAAPPSPKKMVRSRSPASTRVEAEVALPCWLSSPLPALPEAAPVKTKRLPRLRKIIRKMIPFNPFKNRSRAP
ncbi:hypothetical protein M407DRAFT_34466 [Tulasnella calospora MUT 4182]|uniref:Uncharacterized protein n=1 Tax=Tulasnella calospora MUT 4182 TaxID=1051891 RepID=A0A0C3PNC5_9AGAM|nr:hypothetical protein M407DRAFT_34466 [Tulasnella calospora MUT 4182]